MDEVNNDNGKAFYEEFWQDASYQLAYAFDSAVRDRFPAIKKVWGDLRPPGRVLDFGCGNGVLTYWLSCNGFGNEVIGVDVSNTGIANAQKCFSRPSVQYLHASRVPEMVAEKKIFDAVVSSHVLEHIPSPEKVLAELLPLGEWFVIEVPLEDCLWPNFHYAIRGKQRRENSLGHVNFWNKKTFRRFIEENGLMIVRDYHYASAPFSPYSSIVKRLVERVALGILGLSIYSRLMATHYAVLARRT